MTLPRLVEQTVICLVSAVCFLYGPWCVGSISAPLLILLPSHSTGYFVGVRRGNLALLRRPHAEYVVVTSDRRQRSLHSIQWKTVSTISR
jgi:hypothetical protein